MDFKGRDLENLPHPASEEADTFESLSARHIEKISPKYGETETRYIVRFEEAIFDWVNDQRKAGFSVSKEEVMRIFDSFFTSISQNPIYPSEKARDFPDKLINRDNINLLLGRLSSNIDYNDEGDSYKKTTRERNLFFPDPSGKPYIKTLFGIRENVFDGLNVNDSSGVFQYIGSKINQKRILNIGGHNMLKDFLTKGDLRPECIVNADPFIESENVDMNKKGVYKSIHASASDRDLEKKLLEEGSPNQYDEVWASFSVPLYLKDTEEISSFFYNIRRLLTIHGTLRIFPFSLAVQGDPFDGYSEHAVADYHKRRARLVEEILILKSDDRFSIDLVPTYEAASGPVYALLIQRLK